MKRLFTTIVLLSTVASMAAGSLWPTLGPDSLRTQIATGGYIYGIDDSENGGNSTFIWPNGVDEYEVPYLGFDGALPIVFEENRGLDDLYAGLGVDMRSENDSALDLSNKQGFCLSYASESPMELQIRSLAYGDSNYDYYTMSIPNTNGIYTTLEFPFTFFKQLGWYSVTSITEVKSSVTALVFLKLNQSYNQFTLKQLGYMGECDDFCGWAPQYRTGPPPSSQITCICGTVLVDGKCVSAIQSISLSSSIKAQLSGKVLAFTGLGKETWSVQVVNLQGQVYQSAIVTSAKSNLNLSLLPAGVYMIRATGANSQISQRIVIE